MLFFSFNWKISVSPFLSVLYANIKLIFLKHNMYCHFIAQNPIVILHYSHDDVKKSLLYVHLLNN